MSELINGRTPEEIKRWVDGRATCNTCPKEHEVGCEYGERTEDCQMTIDTIAYIERLESERDAAILDLKAISHCYTCSNRDLDDNGVCKNSGGGGAPFMQCPGYVWDKKLPEPPEGDA